jgi:RNA polymerase sigma-70 factor (ECF subfamily)
MVNDAHSPDDTPFDWDACIAQARAGSAKALGRLLEACRSYLLLIANHELGPGLRAKVAPSDLVQETCLEAHRDFGQFRGVSEPELYAWLRQVLLHNLGHLRQRYAAQRRDVGMEQARDADDSGEDLLDRAAADTPSPSSHVRAQEEQELLERALARLSEDHRQAILLRHREYLSFAEIGRRMGRSEDAAQKLWTRAVESLRREIGTPP